MFSIFRNVVSAVAMPIRRRREARRETELIDLLMSTTTGDAAIKQALEELMRRQTDTLLDALCDLIQRRNGIFKDPFIDALGQFDKARAIPALEDALRKDPANTRLARALLAIDPAWRSTQCARDIQAALIEKCETTLDGTGVLTLLPTPAAARPLVSRLVVLGRNPGDSFQNTGNWVRDALVAIGSPAVVEILDALSRLPAGIGKAGYPLVEALASTGTSSDLASVFACYSNHDRFHRCGWLSEAAKRLLKLDRDWESDLRLRPLLAQFIEALDDVDLDVSVVAIRALGGIGDPLAICPLLFAFVFDPHRSFYSVWPRPKESPIPSEVRKALTRIDPNWAERPEARSAVPQLRNSVMSDDQRASLGRRGATDYNQQVLSHERAVEMLRIIEA